MKAKEEDVRAETHGLHRLGIDNCDSSSSLGLPSQPPRFPKRIRTQWDCVLDEVKWLATDFIEERKWKTASSTKLSNELMKHTKEGKKQRRGSVSARRANGKVGSTPAKATEARGRRYVADTNPLFVKPSGEDLKHTRNVAQLMSSTINSQWDRIVNGDECASEEKRSSRFGLVKCEMIGSCDESSPETDFSAEQVQETCGVTDTKQQQHSSNELDNDQITAQLQLIARSMKSIRVQCSAAFVHGDCRQSMNCSVELNSSQLESVNLMDNCWTRTGSSVTASPRSAVLLGGNLGCGKTVSACALLWKYRDIGRQLIVCSSDALVSFPGAVRLSWMRWQSYLVEL